jgi:hypothetical protein
VRSEGRLWQSENQGKKADPAQIVVLEAEPEPIFFLVPD